MLIWEGGGTPLAFIVSTNVALDIDRLSLSFHCFSSAIVDDTRPTVVIMTGRNDGIV